MAARVHPITRALRVLRGQRSLNGRPLPTPAAAVATLRRLTGRDFGINADHWGEWLRDNRWVYAARRNDPRLVCSRRIQDTLDRFRDWVGGRWPKPKCRVVQYWDPDVPTAFDVKLGEIDAQIEGLVGEGFRVDWAEHDGKIYLLVWQNPNPKPDWPQVFAETW